MRTSIKIFIFCILVIAAICLLVWLRHTTKPQVNTSPQSEDVLTKQQARPEPQQPMENRQISNTLRTLHLPPSASPLAKALALTNPIAARQLAQWQAPIEFYGKVVDENSNAVAGAKVDFHWVEIPAEDGNRTTNTESDTEGLFSLHGQLGPHLSVSVSKEGYYASHNRQGGFNYSLGPDIISPDPLNPVVFRLQKKGSGEPLVTVDYPGFGKTAQLRGNGTPVEVDLLKGEKAATGSGQIKLELWRGVSEKGNARFDWKCQLSVPGGGLVTTDQEFAFEAPQNGYQPSVVIDMPATNQNWRSDVRLKYFLQMADGKYGRIEFYLLPWNGAFTIQSAVNYSGSRNLEPNN